MYEISDSAIDRFYGEYERPTYCGGRLHYDPLEYEDGDDEWKDEWEDEWEDEWDEELDEDLDAIEALSACEELGL